MRLVWPLRPPLLASWRACLLLLLVVDGRWARALGDRADAGSRADAAVLDVSATRIQKKRSKWQEAPQLQEEAGGREGQQERRAEASSANRTVGLTPRTVPRSSLDSAGQCLHPTALSRFILRLTQLSHVSLARRTIGEQVMDETGEKEEEEAASWRELTREWRSLSAHTLASWTVPLCQYVSGSVAMAASTRGADSLPLAPALHPDQLRVTHAKPFDVRASANHGAAAAAAATGSAANPAPSVPAKQTLQSSASASMLPSLMSPKSSNSSSAETDETKQVGCTHSDRAAGVTWPS